MVGQFPECTNGGQADLSITAPKHLHDLRNVTLHGVMGHGWGEMNRQKYYINGVVTYNVQAARSWQWVGCRLRRRRKKRECVYTTWLLQPSLTQPFANWTRRLERLIGPSSAVLERS
jgi:hypothetical protein